MSRDKTVLCGALWYHLLVSALPTKTVKVNYSLHLFHISILYELSVHKALKSHQCKWRYRVSMAHSTTDRKNPVLWVFLNNDDILSYSCRMGMLTMMFTELHGFKAFAKHSSWTWCVDITAHAGFSHGCETLLVWVDISTESAQITSVWII